MPLMGRSFRRVCAADGVGGKRAGKTALLRFPGRAPGRATEGCALGNGGLNWPLVNADTHREISGKRLVIFGCGYIGGEFARQAVGRGLAVAALTRNAAVAHELRAAGVETIVADLADSAWHERIAGGADFALNCVSSGGGGLAGYRRSYVEGMASVVAWAQRRGAVGTMVFTSSTSVYPQGGGARVDENSPTADASERGEIMLEAENALGIGVGACARWFILRLAGIYGPGRHALLDQIRAGEVPGRGEHRLNLAHRDDICAAIWAAMLAPPRVRNEIFNVADDGAAPKTELAAWLAQRLAAPAPRFTDQPVAGRRPATPDRIIVNAKLRATLDWRPRFATFREGYENILSR